MRNIENLTATTTAAEVAETTVTLTTAANESAKASAAAAQVTDKLVSNWVSTGAITRQRAVQTLEQLENARISWEGNELSASHARLYDILTNCYAFYLKLKGASTGSDVRKELTKGLDLFIKQRGLKTLAKTHDMVRVVKAVFGEDRRRVSAYASALRVALTAGAVAIDGTALSVPAANLAAWITAQGGIEEIRKGAVKGGVTTAERIVTAAEAIQDKPLMSFKPDTKALSFSSDDADKMMVLVVTYRPTGELEVNSVIKSGAVLNAALAAHYSTHKADMVNAKAAATDAPLSAVSIALANTI